MVVLAVAAKQEYKAVKAARRIALAAKWKVKQLSEENIYSQLTANRKDRFFVEKGCVPSTTREIPELMSMNEDEHITVNAVYQKPYHMHASIGPSAGCAHLMANRYGLDPQSVFILLEQLLLRHLT